MSVPRAFPDYIVDYIAGPIASSFLATSAMPSWVVNPANPPDLMFNFGANQAWLKTGSQTVPASSLLTTVRAAPAAYVNDAQGNWTAVNANLPRLSNLGLLVEESRTNSIRNNSMQGAIAATVANTTELIVNGTFTGTTGAGWTTVLNGGTGSVNFGVPGQATVTGDGVHQTNLTQSFATVIGLTYRIQFTASAGFFLQVGNSAGNSAILGEIPPAGTISSVRFTATATTTFVGFALTVGSTIVSNISVQNTAELVNNNDFALNPINAAQSTAQNGWAWDIGGGTAGVTYGGVSTVLLQSDGNAANFYSPTAAPIPTVNGVTYTLTLTAAGGTSLGVRVGTSQKTSGLLDTTTGMGAGLKFQFTASSATSFLFFYNINIGTTVTISAVSVQSAGVLPTNWSVTNVPSGIVYSVKSLTTISGLPAITLTVAGTPGSTIGLNVQFEGATQIAATYGQTWSLSSFVQYSNVTNIGVSTGLQLVTVNGGGGGIGSITNFATPTVGALARTSFAGTPSNSSNAFLLPSYQMNLVSGNAVNYDVTLAAPQFENNNINSSVASAAVHAAGGGAGYATNDTGTILTGTGTAATYTVTGQTAGVVTSVSVTPGSYSVFPPDSGTGVSTATGGAQPGIGVGLLLDLTPTNNAASAYATSPIRTTSVAVTRAGDYVLIANPTALNVASHTMYAAYSPLSTQSAGSSVLFGWANALSFTNVDYASFTAAGFIAFNVVGATGAASPGGVGALTLGNDKYAAAYSLGANGMYHALNGTGGALGNGGTVAPTGPANFIAIGSAPWGAGSNFSNGFFRSFALWYTQPVPNGQLQTMTA